MDPVTIGLLISAGTSIINAVIKAREAAQQSGEWTPEQEAAFQMHMSAVTAQPHWKILSEKKAP